MAYNSKMSYGPKGGKPSTKPSDARRKVASGSAMAPKGKS